MNDTHRKKAISFQTWLHHLRFIFTAGMLHAWASFGGLVDQLNHFALLLSLASLESAGYAMRYHATLATTLADYARARYPIDYHIALSEIHEDTREAMTRGSTAVAVRFTNASANSENSQRFHQGKSRPKGKGKGKAPLKRARRVRSAPERTLLPSGKGRIIPPNQTLRRRETDRND